MVVGTASILVLMNFVVPRFAIGIRAIAGSPIPVPTKVLMDVQLLFAEATDGSA